MKAHEGLLDAMVFSMRVDQEALTWRIQHCAELGISSGGLVYALADAVNWLIEPSIETWNDVTTRCEIAENEYFGLLDVFRSKRIAVDESSLELVEVVETRRRKR